jgi:hypothetical protein
MKDFKVPESLEELGDSAFHGCIEISGKLSTHITGRYSFADCGSIRRLDLDDSITHRDSRILLSRTKSTD